MADHVPTAPWEPGTVGPDLLEPEARRALDLMDGERLLGSWRVARGYLILTDLRCLRLWHHVELLGEDRWRSGPSFFFYDMPPPVVLGPHSLELREDTGADARSTRFQVADAPGVGAAIAAQRGPGREAWSRRRDLVAGPLEALRAAWPGRPGVTPTSSPCIYCGNLVPTGATHCPSCGAPQG